MLFSDMSNIKNLCKIVLIPHNCHERNADSFTVKKLSLNANIYVVSLTEIITNVDEVDLIMFNSISKSNTKSNKNNLDVVQLAASVRKICIQ